MTGKELIIYILANNLEDEPIVKDGKLVGFLTVSEVAERMDVGTETVYTWVARKQIKSMVIGNRIYIPADFGYVVTK